ncbi:MAG TPA: peptidoglycan-binding protein [Candidatus Limnocylindria bacterium]|nr:peptidoglycan-binding protein [Candidatus Limnocylindria bacterium]
MKRLPCLVLALLLLLPGAFAQEAGDTAAEADVVIVTSEGRELRYDDSGDDVRALQERLKHLGYYSGPISGLYKEVTTSAVKAVQKAYGLEETGRADLALQQIVYGDAHRPLSSGMQGQQVSRLQTRLGELGYFSGRITGNYLNVTASAVSAFQRDNGLPETGKADVRTLVRLYSDDIFMPTPGPAATPRPVPTPPPDAAFRGTVGYGDKDDRVRMAQERLAALGFFDRKVTGGFYEHTATAVKAFQGLNGLTRDGVIGETTWNALFAADAIPKGGQPRPTPAPTPIPYSIEVDVNNQLIKVWGLDGYGQHTKLEKVFVCSTGTKSYPSELGTFTLTGRKAKWAEFPNWGGGKARWWVRINSDIAFHSIIYNSNNLDDVNMSSVRKLGSRASHGCIRLTVADAQWIYDNVGKGTVVRIHEDAPPDPELKAAHMPGSFNKNTYLHNPTPAPFAYPPFDMGHAPQEPARPLKKGHEGIDVYWVQGMLRELGYYAGTVTGTYLEGTEAAVRAFRKDQGLGSSAGADAKTLQRLYDLARERAMPAATPLPTDAPGALGMQPDIPLPAFVVEGDTP